MTVLTACPETPRGGGTSSGAASSGAANSGASNAGASNAGSASSGSTVTSCTKVSATIRDFHDSHPDFERGVAGAKHERGIVAKTLGTDDKPVYAATASTTTAGADPFNQWFNDVPGVNERIEQTLNLSKNADGLWGFEKQDFFPIETAGFGKEGQEHNFHFTLEIHTQFKYEQAKNMVFRFRGDDDVWVFINKQLVIDLGGYHSMLEESVALNALPNGLVLQDGQSYDLDFFFAERQSSSSNLLITTSLCLSDDAF